MGRAPSWGILGVVERNLVSVAEAARLLGVPEGQVWQRIADGTLTHYQRGREVLIDRAEVEESER